MLSRSEESRIEEALAGTSAPNIPPKYRPSSGNAPTRNQGLLHVKLPIPEVDRKLAGATAPAGTTATTGHNYRPYAFLSELSVSACVLPFDPPTINSLVGPALGLG
jgi:hypothetical protein